MRGKETKYTAQISARTTPKLKMRNCNNGVSKTIDVTDE